MGGVTLWIILGALVGIVAIFLIVASIKDRKKVKHVKELEKQALLAAKASVGSVAIYINLVAQANRKLLKHFVPSVGKLKMSDIKAKAKEALKELEKSDAYTLALKSESKDKIKKGFEELKHSNSNTWDKNASQTLKYFIEVEESLTEDKEKYNQYKKEVKVELKRVYK